VSMIEFLGNLKFFGTFHLSLIGELVGYSQNFQPQEVVNIPHITYPHSTYHISHTNISTYHIPTYQHITYHIPHTNISHITFNISHTNIPHSTYPHTNIYFTPYYLYCLRVFFIAPIFVFADIPLSCSKTIPLLEFKSIL
jgi:hypothetical protein